MCMVWPCLSFVDGLSLKYINVYKKKVKLINQDCLPISILLYIMLCIMLAYLMLFAALSNAVCLHYPSFFPFISVNAFRLHALSWSIVTWFVYFMC